MPEQQHLPDLSSRDRTWHEGLRLWSWRPTRLAPLFLLLTAIPLFLANLSNEIAVRKIRISELETEMTTWVAMVVRERSEVFVENVRAIQQLIDSGFLHEGAETCRNTMVWLAPHLPAYQRLLGLDENGVVRCASRPEDLGQNLAAHSIYREALRSDGMVRQPASMFPNSREVENAFAKSFISRAGRRGVMVSLSDGSWLHRLEEVRVMPEGGRLYLSDLDGNVVNATPQTAVPVRRLPSYLRPFLEAPGPGTANVRREDGQELFVRYSRPEDPADHTLILMVLDRDQALTKINAASRNSVMMAVLIFVGSLLIAGVSLARFLRSRDRMNSRFRQNEERLRLALEAARAGSFEYLPQSGQFLASPDFYLMMGREPSDRETQPQAWLNAILEEDRDRIVRLFRSALSADNNELRFEYRVARPGGGHRWIETIARVYKDADGRPVRVSGLSIDTTDHKQLELDLRAAKDEAERATVAKSRFLAAASHDLRQPMQSLFLFAEALKRHLDEAGQDKLAQLVRSLDALKMLLDSLLDVSKLDAGLVEPTIEDFPLSEVTGDLAAAYSSVARTHGLDWAMTVPAIAVRSDRVLLARLLRNLLENALRYTERGRIDLRAMVNGDQVNIEVADSGIGIADSVREKIFEEFFQVGNAERNRQQGLGLGLAIVKRIADLLGHRISVVSAPGRGSIFTLTVPLAAMPDKAVPGGEDRTVAVAETPPTGTALVKDQPGPPPASGPLHAVVIDDEVLVLLGMEAMLKERGFTVTAASSADQALEKLKNSGRKPDVILADYRLGHGRLGTEAIAAVRAFVNQPVPAFLLTGETAADTLRAASSQGLTVLNKPITARQLMGALAGVTGG